MKDVDKIDNDEEIQYDTDETSEDTVKKLREKLKKCQAENKGNLDGWQRCRADLINYKKETDQRFANITDLAKENSIIQFLPVLDSFNMAFANKETWDKIDANWRQGIEYIYSQMTSVLENNGVSSFAEIGDQFDPKMHEATEEIETEDPNKDHLIHSVLQKGYRKGEKILRVAKVKVNRLKE
jgi:molecular chaperone GrpE